MKSAYIRRDAAGRIKKEVDVGRSLAADRRSKSKKVAKSGQGDRRPGTKAEGNHEADDVTRVALTTVSSRKTRAANGSPRATRGT